MAGTREPLTDMRLLFVRVVWVFLGPAAMFVTLCRIVSEAGGWATPLDAIFFALLVLTVAARWVGFRAGDRQTMSDEVATPAHVRRYVWNLSVAATGAWAVGNVLGNHVLR